MDCSNEKIGDEKQHGTGSAESAPFDINDYTIIKEGEAEILMHKNEVFYNKAQVYNRDMSIAVLRTFISKRQQEHEAKLLSMKIKKEAKNAGEAVVKPDDVELDRESNGKCDVSQDEACSISENPAANQGGKCSELQPPQVLEALSASGLRALRYAREVDEVGKVVALDNKEAAVESCKRNIKFNGSVACAKVESHLADARVYMLQHERQFDVVDLDPYGTPAEFLDSAVQSVADGGILMCTATDMAVLCGGNGEVCYSKYGAYALKGKYCHEMALRILLACIESHANRHRRHIVPVLSVQMDFYVRVFVRVYSSASAMKNTPLKLSYVYQCTGCDSFHLQPVGRTVTKNTSVRHLPGFGPAVAQLCGDCGKRYNMGGPIWSAPMHDMEWVNSMLADTKAMKDRYPAYDKISSVLTTVSEELPDVPLYMSLHSLCATLSCTSPKAEMFRSAVINAGYRISGSHINGVFIKTDAPTDVIWDIMRCWLWKLKKTHKETSLVVKVKSHPVKPQPPDRAGSVILAKEPTLKVDFSKAVGALSKAQMRKVARFLPNPEKHWGPKVRAGRTITSKHASLLGPDVVNGLHKHDDEGDEPASKRAKTEESTPNL